MEQNWMEQNRQWYYRGSLKSCNYTCSYCPFSKKKGSTKELSKDKEQFFRFIERLKLLKGEAAAVQIVPYGEALIHSYYWEGLAKLSNIPEIEVVGAQSNFSFPVEKMLSVYLENGGQADKLRLWGTFHPEMTTVESFVKQCKSLSQHNVVYCVGVVGNPAFFSIIRSLREELDDTVYLWINKMDGLGRNYTEEEKNQFQSIDPYFMLELKYWKADNEICGNQIFVEADGTLRKCNICRPGKYNLYDEISGLEKVVCNRKQCSCYLAYNNRMERDMLFFKPYPAFRIPQYPKAVFLDVDGTLIPEGQKKIPAETIGKIQNLAKYSAIYLATSLPEKDAFRKVTEIQNVLSGGVFANGGRCIVLRNDNLAFVYDKIAKIDDSWIENARKLQKKYGFRLHVYQKENQVYKVTLSFPRKRSMLLESDREMVSRILQDIGVTDDCKWFIEENCIEIIKADRGKLEGILEIMEVMGYQREEVMVAGNSVQDDKMLEYFQHSVRV